MAPWMAQTHLFVSMGWFPFKCHLITPLLPPIISNFNFPDESKCREHEDMFREPLQAFLVSA